MYSVPIQADSQRGIGELKGVLRFDGSRLTLQYQIADTIMHEFRTAAVELELEPAELVDAQYRAGFLWLRPTIDIRVSDIARVSGLPSAEAGRLRFRVPRGNRADARKIVDGVNAACAEVRFVRLNESIARMTASDPAADRAVEAFPPRRPAIGGREGEHQ